MAERSREGSMEDSRESCWGQGTGGPGPADRSAVAWDRERLPGHSRAHCCSAELRAKLFGSETISGRQTGTRGLHRKKDIPALSLP